jgi:hypothetical protein
MIIEEIASPPFSIPFSLKIEPCAMARLLSSCTTPYNTGLWNDAWEEFINILAVFLPKFQKNLCHIDDSFMTVSSFKHILIISIVELRMLGRVCKRYR